MGAARLLPTAFCGLLLPLMIAGRGLLHASKNDQPQLTKDYCINYNSLKTLPSTLSGTSSTNLIVLTHKLLCNHSEVLTEQIKDKAVAIKRGTCTFLEKADIAESHGAKILLIVSETELVSPDVNVSIQVALIRNVDILDMQKTLGNNINVTLYSPPLPTFDYSLVVIFLIAVLSVALGSYWSGMLELENLKASASSGSLESQGKKEECVLTPPLTVVFVIMSAVMLILMYFFYKWLVYFFIAVFCLSSAMSLFSCLAVLIRKIPFGQCRVTFRNASFEVRLIFLAGICMATSIVWGVFRNEDRWAWILQDILGASFCIHLLKIIKLPHFKSCVILLSLLLVYDVFFVFITPYITKSGQSIMVEVAAGPPGVKEKLPVLIKVPRLQFFSIPTCDVQFSILGLGDIVVPGLLVAYCHRFDVQTSSSSVYFISNVIAYALGMVITFVALALMKMPQPALLYLAPCTLIAAALVALCRKEMKKFWNGSTYQVMDLTANEENAPTAREQPRRQ
ncbi:signal peptide peptidase-like 2A isoform X2 [Tiliqua scincoides]|uniref:signal peptide peptidase-like 2A isoform X2 n=1 Tax=Tiliqua scincoides TaxID=71010 RepID=UPI003462725E